MSYGEILSSFLIDLQRIFRKKIKIQNASFQQIMALSAIPSKGIEMTPLAKKIGIDNQVIEKILQTFEFCDHKKAKILLGKKFKGPATSMKEKAKRRDYLMRRGFSFSISNKLVLRDN